MSTETAVHRQRRPWSAQEDQQLRIAVNRENPGCRKPSKWHAIATHVPDRTNKDCRKRWFAKLAKIEVVKGNWSPDEDTRLLEAIKKYGPRWTIVATAVETRNSDQCAKRWKDTLDPKINRDDWTPAEDQTLLEAVETHGKFWSKIVRTYFPGRTGLAAKNRYNSVTRSGSSSFGPRRASYASDASSPSSSSSSSSSSAASPITPSAMIADLSPSTFPEIQQSSFDLNAFPWSPATFPEHSTLDSLALDQLFSMPQMQFSDESPSTGPKNSDVVLSSQGTHSSVYSFNPSPHPLSLSTQSGLKLYGSQKCASTARIRIVLHEKDIPYVLVDKDADQDMEGNSPIVGKPSSAQYPYIEDDGFVLYESRAICRYLATKHADKGTKLIPDAYNIKAGALFEQAVFREVFEFDPYANKAAYEKCIKQWKGLAPDEAAFEASIAGLSSKLEGYEDTLSRQKYLAGDELTLADLYHIPYGAMLTEAGSDIMIRKGPNVSRWWKDISSRASWMAIKMET